MKITDHDENPFFSSRFGNARTWTIGREVRQKKKKTNPGPHSWFLDKPQSQKRDLTGENGPKVQFLAQCRPGGGNGSEGGGEGKHEAVLILFPVPCC